MEYTPALVFSALLALILEWFPGVSAWWAALSAPRKTALNAFGVALISIASMLIACQRGNECPADVWGAVSGFLLTALLSLGVNQATYQAAKREHFA
jgi:hypothetical protein